MLDYPHIRSGNVCPLCLRYKYTGLVTCWLCYHAWGMRYGNEEAEDLIREAEAKLREAIEYSSEESKLG